MQINIVEGIAEKGKEDLRRIRMLVMTFQRWRTRKNKQQGLLTETEHTANITKGLANATRVVCLVIAPAIML